MVVVAGRGRNFWSMFRNTRKQKKSLQIILNEIDYTYSILSFLKSKKNILKTLSVHDVFEPKGLFFYIIVEGANKEGFLTSTVCIQLQ